MKVNTMPSMEDQIDEVKKSELRKKYFQAILKKHNTQVKLSK